jgi:hypothetical protein
MGCITILIAIFALAAGAIAMGNGMPAKTCTKEIGMMKSEL